jgi:hypothetical protein
MLLTCISTIAWFVTALFKKKDVVNNKQIYFPKIDIETRKTELKECTYDNLENHYTCKPCHKSLQRGGIPKFACPR